MSRNPRQRHGAQPAGPPEFAEILIDAVGADGDGIGTRPDGSRLYVPATVPGDFVRVRLTPGSVRAELGTILRSGPDRREPFCRHFGICGGCTSQHWNDAAYLDWKTARLAQALRRAGYDEPSMRPIIHGFSGTRRRMDLAARRGHGTFTLGLHQARSGDIVDLAECGVLHPALFALVVPMRAMLSGLAAIRRQASAVVNLLDSGPDVLLRTDGALVPTDRVKLTQFAHTAALPRISWAHGDDIPEAICVTRPPETSLSGASIIPPAGAFLQATRDGEAAIIEAVLAGLPVKRRARARALELFAGCGTISFALAPHIRVLAFEGDHGLVSACHNGINQAGLMGKMEIARRDLARQPVLAKELAAFSVVVLDPPHAGAVAQMPHIAQSKVPTVIYVSCDPASLGRDAAVLHGAGYRLEQVTPIDQFAWSARLEAVAVFRAP